jgi:uncharacterized protein (TIGR03086 family)
MASGLMAVGAAVREEEPDPELMTNKDVLGRDPVRAYAKACKATVVALKENQRDVIEKTFRMPYGDSPALMALGIFGTDQLVHGWDLAKATGQDAKLPHELAEFAWAAVGGRLTEDKRGDLFKPEISVDEHAPVEEKLIAYVGRHP